MLPALAYDIFEVYKTEKWTDWQTDYEEVIPIFQPIYTGKTQKVLDFLQYSIFNIKIQTHKMFNYAASFSLQYMYLWQGII